MKSDWVFLFIGIVFLVSAVFTVINRRLFLARAISTKGKVIQIEKSTSQDSDGDYSTTYRPVVEFRNNRGKVTQFTSKLGRGGSSFKVGQDIKVLYDPKSPNSAVIGTFMEFWFFSVLLSFLGIAFTVFGVFVVLYPK